MLAHPETLMPKVELRKVVKILKRKDGRYKWHQDNCVEGRSNMYNHNICYFAVKYGKNVSEITGLCGNRKNLFWAIARIDLWVATYDDIQTLQKHSSEDDLMIQVVEE